MLELTTKRKTLAFKLDGEDAEIPIELTRDEMAEMSKAFEKAGGDLKTGKIDKTTMKSTEAMFDWFAGFVTSYLGDKAQQLSYDGLAALFSAWNDERKTQKEPATGES